MATNDPQAHPDEPVSAEDKTLDKLLAEAQARLDEQKDAWMRAVAEAENVRKRAQADVSAAHKYGVERLAFGLLPVIDSLEAAVAAKDLSAIELTARQLQGALEKASIREINPAPGERFDPHAHQAMAAVDSDLEPNRIVSIMQKGYRLHDRVLRPALVTVAKSVENGTGNPKSDSNLNSD